MGPHEANLRGLIATDQLRGIAELTIAGIQTDIERNHVVEIPEVDVVRCEKALSPAGSAYGIKRPTAEAPIPIAPTLDAFAGRYRAWVLPLSGVAVALEPLDEEASYLREHRRLLFELQHVEDAALIPLTELRLGHAMEFGENPQNFAVSLFSYLAHRFVRSYFEARFEKRVRNKYEDDPFAPANPLYPWLVIGARYRIRPTKKWRHIVEPVVPEEDLKVAGPYR